MLIDTHCHYNHDRFAGDAEAAIERAHAAGVEKMVVVGYDLASSEQAIALAGQHPGILYAAVGIHPHNAKDWNDEVRKRLQELTSHPSAVAYGEIGLDFHYDFSSHEDQFSALHTQLEIAAEAGLPIIFHCREAYTELLALLADYRGIDGVMHCWAGTVAEAQQTAELGLSLGFGGTITFKNAEEVRQSALSVPQDRLLLETDAPYLAPVPHRGKRNEPAYTRLVADKMAEVLNLSFEEVAALTTANARRVFPLLLK